MAEAAKTQPIPLLRAGELSAAELENIMNVVGKPEDYKVPRWFLNRQKDHKDGTYSQVCQTCSRRST